MYLLRATGGSLNAHKQSIPTSWEAKDPSVPGSPPSSHLSLEWQAPSRWSPDLQGLVREPVTQLALPPGSLTPVPPGVGTACRAGATGAGAHGRGPRRARPCVSSCPVVGKKGQAGERGMQGVALLAVSDCGQAQSLPVPHGLRLLSHTILLPGEGPRVLRKVLTSHQERGSVCIGTRGLVG